MRRTRLRLRSPILLVLAALTLFFFITLYTLIWSADELEHDELNRDIPIPPGVIPFWSALNHPNIYDLHATPSNPVFARSADISQSRIEELSQLIRDARTQLINTHNKKIHYPIDPSWNFQRLVEQQKISETDETNKHNPDTADSAEKNKTSKTTKKSATSSTQIPIPISEFDKTQLRNYIHQSLNKWRKEHKKDKIITIADIMRDDLLEEEPSYVFGFVFILTFKQVENSFSSENEKKSNFFMDKNFLFAHVFRDFAIRKN